MSDGARFPEEPARVLLVSQQRLFRDCLAEQLHGAEGFAVVGEAEDLEPGITSARRSGAHLLLIDGGCLNDGAYALLSGLSEQPKAVVLGLRDLPGDLRRCVEAGISGVLYREMPLDELSETLAAVLRGERVCGATPTRDLFARVALLARRDRQHERLEVLRLTPRQMEVLRLVACGHGNEEIARRLCLSAHTVKNHVHNILLRLDAKDRAEAVAHAYERNWLP